jgi:phosphatidylglycerol:prolipoprotein diacylglycerol transferase
MQSWYVHDLSSIAFEVFGLPVRWYGLSYAAGFLIGERILELRARLDARYPPNFSSGDFVLYAIAGVLIGGRLGEVLFYNARWFLEHPLHILFLWEGGMSSHGGMLGLLAATWLFAVRHGPAPLVLIDDVVLAATPGLFLGRVANFINAEMIGKTADVPWAVVFPRADMAPRHPVQLYQALCEGPILAGILLYAMRCDLRPGQRGSLFLVSYGALRLVTEAFREVDAEYLGLWHGLTSGQLLSFAMILVGALIFYFLRRSAAVE